MRFWPGYWTHENFMDVVVQVHKTQYEDNKRSKLKVTWWNRGWSGKPWPLYQNQPLEVKNFNGWKRINDIERFVHGTGTQDIPERKKY